MSTSGTDVFSISSDALISAALRVIRVLQDGQTASTNDLTNGREALNLLLKNWQSRGLVISKMGQVTIPCVANQLSYTIGPVGADITSVRPLRVYDGSFIRSSVIGIATDITLENISRQNYEQQKTKAVIGTTGYVYYFPGISTSPATGFGTIYLITPAVDNTYTIYLNVQLPVFDITTGANEVDLPKEWQLAVKWGLAAQIADEYEVPEDRIMRLTKTAEYYLSELEQWQNDINSVAYGDDRSRAESYRDAEKTQKG